MKRLGHTMQLQRYVSNLLTHFVGRGKKNESEQYELLVKIIKSGWLLSAKLVGTDTDNLPQMIQQVSYSYPFNLSNLDLNVVFITDVVCFTDIPLSDIQIHIPKYSQFAVSFTKEFLLKNGANPVFYISNDSIDKSEGGINFNQLFRKELQNYINYQTEFQKMIFGKKNKFTQYESSQIKSQMFLLKYFLCFLKFWDYSRNDIDIENFDMEREWRIYGGLKFNLDNVQRIIIPSKFSRILRNDFPEYSNELVFSDGDI